MSKFENILNALLNEMDTPAGMPNQQAVANTSPVPAVNANTNSATPTTTPPGTPNSINTNQQQNKSKPVQSAVDPLKHPVGQDLVNAKTTQQVADALKQKGIQLTPITNK
jgi:hypothetical protein